MLGSKKKKEKKKKDSNNNSNNKFFFDHSLSVRTELEDAEDVVGEDSPVEIVHREPERATRLGVGRVHHQELEEGSDQIMSDGL